MSSVHDSLDVSEYRFEEHKAVVDASASYSTDVVTHVFTDAAVSLAISARVKSIEQGLLGPVETTKLMNES